jgi:hypothetical protein
MGVVPEHVCPLVEHRTQAIEKAEEMFAEIKERADFLLTSLPSMHEYLNLLHGEDGRGTREEDVLRAAGGAR